MRFKNLWNGNLAGYASQSEADLALCNFLAFWTRGDAARIDRLFRRSGLYRAKWEERHRADGRTYGEMTIARAITPGHTSFAYR
jgi:primase-polymerase (primpol)-like protein